jgi:hypothetical protein
MPPPVAVRSITDTTWSMVVPSSSFSGWASVCGVVVICQPGTGCTLTEASGVRSGIWICTRVVLAVSLSSGTLNTTVP